MSARRVKEIRALAYHVEFGGYYPAMRRSGEKLAAMKPTARQLRRAAALGERKIAKAIERERVERARGEGDDRRSRPGDA